MAKINKATNWNEAIKVASAEETPIKKGRDVEHPYVNNEIGQAPLSVNHEEFSRDDQIKDHVVVEKSAILSDDVQRVVEIPVARLQEKKMSKKVGRPSPRQGLDTEKLYAIVSADTYALFKQATTMEALKGRRAGTTVDQSTIVEDALVLWLKKHKYI